MLPNEVHVILTALLEDIVEINDLPMSVMDDVSRIILTSKSRGESIVLETLPSFCSQLEAGLENGYLTQVDGQPFTKDGYPSILLCLYQKIFDVDNHWHLLPEPSTSAIRSLRQFYTCFKKLMVDCPIAAHERKIHEFMSIEQGLISPHYSWGATTLRSDGSRYPHLVDTGVRVVESASEYLPGYYTKRWWAEIAPFLHRIQEISDRIFSNFVFRDEWFMPKHGPGAVSEPYEKSKYEFPTWPDRLETHFPYDLYGLFNHIDYDLNATPDSSDLASKVIAVPKDYRGPRLIASEPIAAQYIQQGLMSVLRRNTQKSVLRHAIDFKSQVPSRERCLTASSDRESSTIDLSSASDRLSCAVVESIFRRSSLLPYLNSARTHKCLVSEDVVELKKFAAQGAAFTFPIQSLVYAVICMGVISFETNNKNLTELAKQVRVYGDDMIVPTRFFRSICDVLTSLQLSVNRSKSFHKGSFRESCGMDAFAGEDVTPAKVNRIFEKNDNSSIVSAVECSNNLFRKGYVRASRALLETIPQHIRKDIPRISMDSTILGFQSPGENNLKERWNKRLHRREMRVLTVEGKVTRTSPDGRLLLFQWFTENPRPDVIWNGGEVVRVKHRYVLRWVPASECGIL